MALSNGPGGEPAASGPVRRLPAGARPRRPRPHWGCILSSPARCLPDFLVIGAQKCGTTSLAAHLHEHPAVWMSPGKECHFFSGPWRPRTLYRAYFPGRWTRRRLEREQGRALLVGEATPYYLFHPAAPRRAARALPRARLIVLLRDPVERAYSHYRHCVRRGLETLSFEEALDAEPQRTAGEARRLEGSVFARSAAHQHYSYIARGHYAEQLTRWLACFDRGQLHVEFAEHLFEDPAAAVARIESFLGLPPGPPRRFEALNRGIEAEPMAPGTRQRLRGVFAESNRALEALLGAELPWPRA